MSTSLLSLFSGIILFFFIGCQNTPANQDAVAHEVSAQIMDDENPLIGAWKVNYRKAVFPDGREEVYDEPEVLILKLFTSGHFTYFRQNTDRSFNSAGGGSYTYTGDSYTETHSYQSVPAWKDYTASWDVRIEGDSHYVTGPTKVVNGEGEDVTEEVWAAIGQVEETFVRID